MRVVAEPGAPFIVVVRWPDGVVAGAVVEATAKARSREDPGHHYTVNVDDASTGETGEANLARVPIGWLYLRVRKRGLATFDNWLEVRDDAPQTLEIALSRGGTIEGRVTAPDGTPVQGARLHDLGSRKVLSTTDAFGRCRIAAIGPDGITPVAAADGYGPGSPGGDSG